MAKKKEVKITDVTGMDKKQIQRAVDRAEKKVKYLKDLLKKQK